MNNVYLKSVVSMFVFVLMICSAAEAKGTSKVFKVGATIPARSFVEAKTDLSSALKNQEMQVTMEKEIRGSQIVMVKTAIVK